MRRWPIHLLLLKDTIAAAYICEHLLLLILYTLFFLKQKNIQLQYSFISIVTTQKKGLGDDTCAVAVATGARAIYTEIVR